MPSESHSFPDNFRAAIRRGPVPQQVPPLPQVDVEIKRASPKAAPFRSRPISPAPAPLEPRKISVVPRAKVRSLCKPKPDEQLTNFETGQPAEAAPANGHEQENLMPTVAEHVAPVRSAPNPALRIQVQRTRAMAAAYPRITQQTRDKRGPKLFRFLMCEALAISVLIPSAILGISRRFTDQNVLLLINILIIAAAATIAILPMLFYGRGETLPQREESDGSPQQRGA